jgi:hypothetical protein
MSFSTSCRQCGRIFHAQRSTARFHAVRCRVAYFRAHQDAEPDYSRIQTPPEPPSTPARGELPKRMSGPVALRILGLSAWPDARTLQKAWRALVREHHPDRGGDSQIIVAINVAYTYLKR